MKTFIKNNKGLILSFIIPIIVFLIACFGNKIYPFGSKLLPMIDGYSQYPGFLSDFKSIILGKDSLFYSLNGILGFNCFATSVYYVFNITNILSFLFSNLMNFYTFSIILKIGLCSLTMCILLNYIKKKDYNYLFAICYALTSYNMFYYLNYMWFDSIIFLPLVILGIEKIFKENKYLSYFIFLSLSILFNFYIGYMICIFSLVYFIYKSVIEGFTFKRIIKYSTYSFLSGLACAFVLLPVILELLNGKASLAANYFSEYFKFDLDFINVFYKMTVGSYINGDLKFGTPNVYVSIFIFINALLFFLNSKIKLKEKIVSGCILAFFLLSMSFNFLDYFWQMMQRPIFYPVRYGFIFDFFLIILAFKNYLNYDKKNILITIIFYLIYIILIGIGFYTSGNLLDPVNIPAKLIYLGISLLFILYYSFLLNSKTSKIFLIALIIFELSINSFVCLRNNGNETTMNDYISDYTENTDVLNLLNDHDFYRNSFKNRTIKNNGLLLNYNDLNLFTSIRNQKSFDFLNKTLGVKSVDGCNIAYNYNNPITNAFLNIRYYATDKENNYYELINKTDKTNLYFNKDATNLGFEINKNIDNYIEDENYLININNLYRLFTSDDRTIMEEIEIKETNIDCKSSCIVTGTKPYVIYEYTAKDKEFMVIVNDYETVTDNNSYLIKINNKEVSYDETMPILLNKNDTIYIEITPKDDFFDNNKYHLYKVNYDLYQNFVKVINQNKMDANFIKDNHFKGTITMNNDNNLLITLSNDLGWKAYVDGKETEIKEVFNGIVSLDLEKGYHEIEFIYYPPGLNKGIIISFVSLIFICLLTIFEKKKSRLN